MEFLFMLIGLSVGSVITQIILRRYDTHGCYTIKHVSDEDIEGLYSISIMLSRDINLLTKKRIILIRKDLSQD